MDAVRYIAFSAGGMKGLVYEGWMEAMEDHMERLQGQSFDTWRQQILGLSGTSAGAISALIFALGFSREVRLQLCKELMDIKLLLQPDVTLLASRFGWDDGRRLRDLICHILTKGGLSPQSTLGDIRRLLRIDFVCCGTDLVTMETVTFSSTKTPHVSVCDAIYASCAIPFVFVPLKLDKKMIVDGCMTACLPAVFPEEKTLFLCIDTNDILVPKTWSDFIQRVLGCSMNAQMPAILERRGRHPETHITIQCDENAFEIVNKGDTLIASGYNQTLDIMLHGKLKHSIHDVVKHYVSVLTAPRPQLASHDEQPPMEASA